MRAAVLIASLAAVALAAPPRPVIPPSFSVNINVTVDASEGTFWNYYASYYAPGAVRLWGSRGVLFVRAPSRARLFPRFPGRDLCPGLWRRA